MSFIGRAGVALVFISCSVLHAQTLADELIPTDELTLADASSLAILHSPDLAAWAWEVRAREEKVAQANAFANPELQLTIEELGSNREELTGGEQTTLQLGQLIELGGKRSARTRVASLEKDQADWDYEIRRIDLQSRVSHAFIEVLSSQGRVALAEETVRLADQSAEVVSERVKGGKASPVEETKATVALAMAEIGLERTRRELEAARRTLCGTWGNTSPHFKTAAGDLFSISPVPELQQLAEQLARNPELALRTTNVSLRQATVDLEKAGRVPDLTVSGGYRNHAVTAGEDAHSYLAEVSIPLPLFNRNRGGIEAARYKELKSKEEQGSAIVRLEIALAESHGTLSAAYSRVLALQNSVLPGAQSAFEAVREGYRLGRFGLLDVLDSQRTLFQARHEYLRAATDYHNAVIDVERLIGKLGDNP